MRTQRVGHNWATFTLSEHIWALFTRTVRDWTERCCWHFGCWCSWKMDAPHIYFQRSSSCLDFLLYQFLLQGPVVAQYWVCNHVPMCWPQGGFGRECLSFWGGIRLCFSSTHNVRNPPIVKWDSNYHQEESVVTVNYHFFVVQYRDRRLLRFPDFTISE